MSKVKIGKPWPLGSSLSSKGVNFSVAAPLANRIEIVLFSSSESDTPSEIIELTDQNRSGDYWHIEIEGVALGCNYCYRVYEENNDSKYLLLDPCARAINETSLYNKNNEEAYQGFIKSIVSERDIFDFTSHPRPKHSWEETIIYELHVGSFTGNKDSEVSSNQQGTFLGLKEKIPYLKELGITAIELLPVFAFDIFDAPEGLENFWGYSPINWFSPHSQYISTNSTLSPS